MKQSRFNELRNKESKGGYGNLTRKELHELLDAAEGIIVNSETSQEDTTTASVGTLETTPTKKIRVILIFEKEYKGTNPRYAMGQVNTLLGSVFSLNEEYLSDWNVNLHTTVTNEPVANEPD